MSEDTNDIKKKIMEGDDSDDEAAEKNNTFLNVYDESKNKGEVDETKDTTLAEVKTHQDDVKTEEKAGEAPQI